MDICFCGECPYARTCGAYGKSHFKVGRLYSEITPEQRQESLKQVFEVCHNMAEKMSKDVGQEV